jgi:CBS domain-containing protein
MTARDLMTPELAVVHVSATAGEAAQLLLRSGREALPVVDDQGRAVGDISDRDLLRLAVPEYLEAVDLSFLPPSAAFFPPDARTPIGDVKVETFMRQSHLPEVGPDEPLAEVARVMLVEDAPRVAVVESGQLIGMISPRDLLRAIVLSFQSDGTG